MTGKGCFKIKIERFLNLSTFCPMLKMQLLFSEQSLPAHFFFFFFLLFFIFDLYIKFNSIRTLTLSDFALVHYF